jgi:hypothetical protein
VEDRVLDEPRLDEVRLRNPQVLVKRLQVAVLDQRDRDRAVSVQLARQELVDLRLDSLGVLRGLAPPDLDVSALRARPSPRRETRFLGDGRARREGARSATSV